MRCVDFPNLHIFVEHSPKEAVIMNTTFKTTAVNAFTGKTFSKNFATTLNALPDEANGRKVLHIGGSIVKDIVASDHWAHFNPGKPATEVVADRTLAAACFNVATDDESGEIHGDHGFMVDFDLKKLHGHVQRVGVVEAGYAGSFADLFANAIPEAVGLTSEGTDPLRAAVESTKNQPMFSVSYDEDKLGKGRFIVGPELVYTKWDGDARLIPAEIAGVNGRIMRFCAFQKITGNETLMVVWNDRFDNYVNVKAQQAEMDAETRATDKRNRIAKKIVMKKAAVGYALVEKAQNEAVVVENGVEVQKPIALTLPTRSIRVWENGEVVARDIDELGVTTLYRTAYGTVLPGKCPLGEDVASRFMIATQAAAGTVFSLVGPEVI
jgi:hypothetical protein